MAELRTVVDQLESTVDAGQWPLPTYREMLVLK
jgi:glutamine synthetase type III